MFNYFGLGGLTEQLNLLLLLKTFMPIITLVLFNAKFIISFVVGIYVNRFIDEGKGFPFSQSEAQATVLKAEFPLTDVYVEILSTVSTMTFYLPIFPLGVVYGLISLIVLFFCYKVS